MVIPAEMRVGHGHEVGVSFQGHYAPLARGEQDTCAREDRQVNHHRMARSGLRSGKLQAPLDAVPRSRPVCEDLQPERLDRLLLPGKKRRLECRGDTRILIADLDTYGAVHPLIERGQAESVQRWSISGEPSHAHRQKDSRQRAWTRIHDRLLHCPAPACRARP